MKKILFVFAVLACAVGCTSKEEIATDVAGKFLKAWYSMDYNLASGLCTEHCSALVLESAKSVSDVPETLLQKMKKASEETSFEIIFVDTESCEGQAIVEYLLTVPGLERALTKRLVLKVEGRAAFVDTVE